MQLSSTVEAQRPMAEPACALPRPARAALGEIDREHVRAAANEKLRVQTAAVACVDQRFAAEGRPTGDAARKFLLDDPAVALVRNVRP